VDHGQRREDPGEEKSQEGTERFVGLIIGETATDFQGEQSLEVESSESRFLTKEGFRGQRQEGMECREAIRLLGKGKPWREKPGRACGTKQAREVTQGENRREVEKT